MNRLTINGVTIEFPSDMQVNITDKFVKMWKISTDDEVKQIITPTPRLVKEREPTGLLTPHSTYNAKWELPTDAHTQIMKFLRKTTDPQHTVAISRMLKPQVDKSINTTAFSKLMASKLQAMKDDGWIDDIAGTKHYGGVNGGSALWAIAKRKGKGNDEHNRDTNAVEHDVGSGSRGATEALHEHPT